MKKTTKKIKVIHSDVVLKKDGKEENLTLPEDKEIILEEEHESEEK